MGDLFDSDINCRSVCCALMFVLLQWASSAGALDSLTRPTILEAKIGEIPTGPLENWTMLEQQNWTSYNLSDCWGGNDHSHVYTDASLFWSPTFGWVVGEKKTWTDYAFPNGTYWEDPVEYETSCQCKWYPTRINPGLSFKRLNQTVRYVRLSGIYRKHIWVWDDDDRLQKKLEGWTEAQKNRQYIITLYRIMVIMLLDQYLEVNASCREVKLVANTPRVPWGEINWSENWFQWNMQWPGRSRTKVPFTQTECHFTGEGAVFEPFGLDFVVQEIDEFSTPERQWDVIKLNNATWRRSVSFAPSTIVMLGSWSKVPWKESIKWIEATRYHNETRDGIPGRKRGRKSYFQYPSMQRGDKNCERRVEMEKRCADPVMGVRGKMAFWDEVNFDPSGNTRRYPGVPLILAGGGRPEGTWKEQETSIRGRRQIFGIAALVFASVNRKDINSLGWQVNDIRSELDAKINDLTDQLNQRLTKDENRMRSIAEHMNKLEAMQYVNNVNLNQVILRIMEGEKLEDERIEMIEQEITDLQKITLKQLDTFLKVVRDVKIMSSAEISLDTLIMNSLQNRTAKQIFQWGHIYKARITRGILYLKKYARWTTDLIQEANASETQWEHQLNSSRELTRVSEEEGDYRLQVWQKNATNVTKLLFFNTSDWAEPNLTILDWNETYWNETFGDHFLNNLGVVISDVSDVLGKGIESIGSGFLHIFGGLFGGAGSFLLPIAIVITILIFCCCLIQNHSKFSHAKAALPTFFQVGKPTGERRINERNKKHGFKKVLEDGAETAALMAV